MKDYFFIWRRLVSIFQNVFKNASFWFAGITTEAESDLVYYIIIILGALFIISLVILLVILYKKGIFRKCKRKCFNSNKVGPVEIIMSKPPLKVQPLYLDEPLRRDKTDVISVLEFNTNFNFSYKQWIQFIWGLSAVKQTGMIGTDPDCCVFVPSEQLRNIMCAWLDYVIVLCVLDLELFYVNSVY